MRRQPGRAECAVTSSRLLAGCVSELCCRCSPKAHAFGFFSIRERCAFRPCEMRAFYPSCSIHQSLFAVLCEWGAQQKAARSIHSQTPLVRCTILQIGHAAGTHIAWAAWPRTELLSQHCNRRLTNSRVLCFREWLILTCVYSAL